MHSRASSRNRKPDYSLTAKTYRPYYTYAYAYRPYYTSAYTYRPYYTYAYAYRPYRACAYAGYGRRSLDRMARPLVVTKRRVSRAHRSAAGGWI
jgi:hypothetical protein